MARVLEIECGLQSTGIGGLPMDVQCVGLKFVVVLPRVRI
jgi:hypothetical protein